MAASLLCLAADGVRISDGGRLQVGRSHHSGKLGYNRAAVGLALIARRILGAHLAWRAEDLRPLVEDQTRRVETLEKSGAVARVGVREVTLDHPVEFRVQVSQLFW